jgi:hypothetical protein
MTTKRMHLAHPVGRHWQFHCPECGFGHQEFGGLGADRDLYCLVCDHETGRLVRLERWLAEEPPPQARLRVDRDD